MQIKRYTWKNDEPATEKQLAYVQSLVERAKRSVEQHPQSDPVATMFWRNVTIPTNLTKKEASGIIDEMKDMQFVGFLPPHLEQALDAIEAGKITGTSGILVASAFYQATNAILAM